ncbi:kinase-like protein [Dothidotthia symphoricarpi CBS 119687]|uniref:Kinase-like protein n=1 Tax=Dothidotthia symphoricarpi CBS 119687 TaxID=1392245 RepID=A0A6A6APG9_9PLEO|nr:kinase-like protein [Dothidotthia symphoricarpi CBS 119687]KAF2132834.1 kinase-like protein [Dothidotthia symphoricarpi CBS 119687]
MPSKIAYHTRAKVQGQLRAEIEKVARGQAGLTQSDDALDCSQAFICYQDVQNIWLRQHRTIQEALDLDDSATKDVELIAEQLLRILSILVYIDARDILDSFRERFLDESGNLTCSDQSLPMTQATVRQRGLGWHFFDDQYLFVPVVLRESNQVVQIDKSHRLPFESISRKVSAGAYGEVDKISISPLYFETKNYSNNKAIVVACKRFTSSVHVSRIDSKREVDNLTVLKGNISDHHHIRVHLSILFHGDEHLILFPWADHSDLHVFLLGGYTMAREQVYDFNLRFPKVTDGTLIADICTQMRNIASALEWLHRGIEHPEARQNRIHLAHMDLKPDNILIDSDEGASTVGKWVLTDFGISTLKEGNEANIMTIRDVFENFTINTSPQRDAGAYQPPEVQAMTNPGKGIAGRGGDIWSFGCIFAETIAFALNRTDGVKSFRNDRKAGHRNNYFYEETQSSFQNLTSTKAYRVRRGAELWLRKLPRDYSFPNRAIECCVETLFDILKVHKNQRPTADELLKMMRHVAYHVTTATQGPQTFNTCPLERDTILNPQPPHAGETSDQLPPRNIPSVIRSDTMKEEILLQNHFIPKTADAQSTGALFAQPLNIKPTTIPSPHPYLHGTTHLETRRSSSFGVDPPVQQQARLQNGFTVGNKLEEQNLLFTEGTSVSSRRLSRESRRDLQGVLIDQDKNREVGKPETLTISDLMKSKILSVSLCRSGDRIGYLVGSKKSNYDVLVYSLDLTNRRMERVQSPIPNSLPTDISWQYLVLAETYIVVWGNSRGRASEKWVYMTDGNTFDVSRRGSIALVCSKLMFYTMAPHFQDPDMQSEIKASDEHSYTHASFNDDGALLYAWQFGRPDDQLYVWRVADSGNLAKPADSEGSYSSNQRGDPNVLLIPYNTQYGCIIRGEGDVFFPAQIRSTQRGSSFRLPKRSVTLSKALTGCVYGNHSLLFVERGHFHTRIWECRIAGSTTHVIDVEDQKQIVELRSTIDEGTLMRIIPISGTDNLMIVLCKNDGKVILIPVVASNSMGR